MPNKIQALSFLGQSIMMKEWTMRSGYCFLSNIDDNLHEDKKARFFDFMRCYERKKRHR